MVSFEELVPVGKQYKSAGRTLSEGEFCLLSDLSWMTGRTHSDLQFMKGTQFGERTLGGPCVLAVVMGLSMSGSGGVRQVMYQDKLWPVGLLGYDEVRFPAAVKPGDTIFAHSKIVSVRPTSKNPKRGVVKCNLAGYNQNNEEVLNTNWNMLVEIID